MDIKYLPKDKQKDIRPTAKSDNAQLIDEKNHFLFAQVLCKE
jgi:hypothetical protein